MKKLIVFTARNPEFRVANGDVNKVVGSMQSRFTAVLGEAAVFGTIPPGGGVKKPVGFRLDYETGQAALKERVPFVDLMGKPPELQRYDPSVGLFFTDDAVFADEAVNALNQAFSGERIAVEFGSVKAGRISG